jgi:hypothetical protein
MARKEKYTTHIKPFLKDITKWISDGQPEYNIYEKLGVSRDLWYKMKKTKNELKDSIIKGEQDLTKNIESMLFKRCMGYETEETKTYIQKIGKKETKKIEKIKKYVNPSDTALIFTLKNREPGKWKDKQEIQQDINAKLENIVIDIEEDEN